MSTAIVAFAAALAPGSDREGAAYLANLAAGIKVGKRGTTTVTVKEIQGHLPKARLDLLAMRE